MVTYNTYEIQIVGSKNVLIKNTLRLFKKDYWYILDLDIPYSENNYSLTVCNQTILPSQVDKKILIKIFDNEIDNGLTIHTEEETKFILKNVKIITLGLLNWGYFDQEGQGILHDRYTLPENINLPIAEFAEKVVNFDGRIINLLSYNKQSLQQSSQTYFRVISKNLSVYEIQQLIAWVKRTYRKPGTSFLEEEIVYVVGLDSSGNVLLITEAGQLITVTG